MSYVYCNKCKKTLTPKIEVTRIVGAGWQRKVTCRGCGALLYYEDSTGKLDRQKQEKCKRMDGEPIQFPLEPPENEAVGPETTQP